MVIVYEYGVFDLDIGVFVGGVGFNVIWYDYCFCNLGYWVW